MANTCAEGQCEVKQDQGVLLIAPCGTIPRVDGKPVIDQALIDSMYRLPLCGPFSYEPDTTNNKRKKYGGCGGTSCTITNNGYDITLPIGVCSDDAWTLALTDPSAECEFDFINFPWPEDCNVPAATDVMDVGSVKTGYSGYTIDPDATEQLIIEVTATSCEHALCRLNADLPIVEIAPLLSNKTATPPLLGENKLAA